MAGPSRGFKWVSVLWALLLGTGLIALAGSVLLPSTKRARVDLEKLRQREQEIAALEAAETATTAPSTAPATAPTTAPTETANHP